MYEVEFLNEPIIFPSRKAKKGQIENRFRDYLEERRYEVYLKGKKIEESLKGLRGILQYEIIDIEDKGKSIISKGKHDYLIRWCGTRIKEREVGYIQSEEKTKTEEKTEKERETNITSLEGNLKTELKDYEDKWSVEKIRKFDKEKYLEEISKETNESPSQILNRLFPFERRNFRARQRFGQSFRMRAYLKKEIRIRKERIIKYAEERGRWSAGLIKGSKLAADLSYLSRHWKITEAQVIDALREERERSEKQ